MGLRNKVGHPAHTHSHTIITSNLNFKQAPVVGAYGILVPHRYQNMCYCALIDEWLVFNVVTLTVNQTNF